MTEYNVHTKPSIKKVAEPLYPHRYKTKAPFGGYGLAGKRHDGESQDAYWPSSIASSTIIDGASVNFTTQAQGESVRFEALDLTSDELKQFGHLYIVSDGVSGCADGTVASRLAVTSVADAYYRALRTQLGKTPPDSYTLEQTLLAAIWAAHYNLRKYDLNLYCYSSKHPKSQTRDFRYGQHKVNDNGDLLCPFCNNRMIALQATMVAVIVRGGWFFAISIGDSRLFQLHNSISQPFGELIPPQASRFLGWRNLQNEHLGRYRGELQNGDHLLLCSDGVIDIYKGQHADRWRQHLTADFQAKDQTLEQLVETNLSGLHNWGNASHNSVFHDDLTIVMCGATSTTAQHTTATSQQTKQAVRSHTLVEREIYKIVNEMGEDRVVQDRLLDLKEVGSQEDDELVEHWRNAYQKYWILKQYFEESAKPELINLLQVDFQEALGQIEISHAPNFVQSIDVLNRRSDVWESPITDDIHDTVVVLPDKTMIGPRVTSDNTLRVGKALEQTAFWRNHITPLSGGSQLEYALAFVLVIARNKGAFEQLSADQQNILYNRANQHLEAANNTLLNRLRDSLDKFQTYEDILTELEQLRTPLSNGQWGIQAQVIPKTIAVTEKSGHIALLAQLSYLETIVTFVKKVNAAKQHGYHLTLAVAFLGHQLLYVLPLSAARALVEAAARRACQLTIKHYRQKPLQLLSLNPNWSVSDTGKPIANALRTIKRFDELGHTKSASQQLALLDKFNLPEAYYGPKPEILRSYALLFWDRGIDMVWRTLTASPKVAQTTFGTSQTPLDRTRLQPSRKQFGRLPPIKQQGLLTILDTAKLNARDPLVKKLGTWQQAVRKRQNAAPFNPFTQLATEHTLSRLLQGFDKMCQSTGHVEQQLSHWLFLEAKAGGGVAKSAERSNIALHSLLQMVKMTAENNQRIDIATQLIEIEKILQGKNVLQSQLRKTLQSYLTWWEKQGGIPRQERAVLGQLKQQLAVGNLVGVDKSTPIATHNDPTETTQDNEQRATNWTILALFIGVLTVVFAGGWIVFLNPNASALPIRRQTPTLQPTSSAISVAEGILPTSTSTEQTPPLLPTSTIPAVAPSIPAETTTFVVESVATNTIAAPLPSTHTPLPVPPTATPMPPTATLKPPPTTVPSVLSNLQRPLPDQAAITGVNLLQVPAPASDSEKYKPYTVIIWHGYSIGGIHQDLAAVNTRNSELTNNAHEPLTFLAGVLPKDPLFQFSGQVISGMIDADGTARLSIVSEQIRIHVTIENVTNSERLNETINRRGWVWLLGSSDNLNTALQTCRNNQNDGGDIRTECADQINLLKGVESINLTATVVQEIPDGHCEADLELLHHGEDFQDRFVYLDFGNCGNQHVFETTYPHCCDTAALALIKTGSSTISGKFQLKPTYTLLWDKYAYLPTGEETFFYKIVE